MSERMWMRLAWAVPKTLAYWCAVRVFSYATVGEYSNTVVPDLTASDALRRWPRRRD